MSDELKKQLLEIFEAGLNAVRPDEALLSHLKLQGNKLGVDEVFWDLSKGSVKVAGAGKGSAPLAKGLEKLLGNRIDEGVVVVKYHHSMPLDHMEIMEASHPVPDKNGLKAAEKILNLAKKCKRDDLLIVLLTGGASALLPAPAYGLSLSDLQKVTQVLLESGAAIDEINTIRKHLSSLSGGQLAKAANGARVLTVIVSDVIGDDLSSIASGPTYPDEKTYNDCLAILDKYHIKNKLPAKALEILTDGAKGIHAETPKPGDPCFKNVRNIIIASNHQALQAAARKAESLGYAVEIMPEIMQGEAREMVSRMLGYARSGLSHLKRGTAGKCLLAGGETTVTIKGTGTGGRNQEMALAASIELAESDGIGCLFAGTDGTDGPVDAAGGFAFGDTAEKMGGVAKAKEFLRNNDSHAALKEAGELLVTGPTMTNVMDMAVILIK